MGIWKSIFIKSIDIKTINNGSFGTWWQLNMPWLTNQIFILPWKDKRDKQIMAYSKTEVGLWY